MDENCSHELNVEDQINERSHLLSNDDLTGNAVPISHGQDNAVDESVATATTTILLDNAAPGPNSTTDQQPSLTILSALRLYPTAVAWSIFFSLGVVMTAFDPQLLGNLYATPAFQRDFGYRPNPGGGFIISAPWQTALGMGNPLGQVFGAFAATYPLERFGRKRTFAVCVVLTAACVALQVRAGSLRALLVGELLGGLVLGSYAVIAPAYASEVCPVPLRGFLTSYINLCFVIGQLLANVVVAGTSRLDTHWAYSAPFAAQWIWPIVILIGLPFAPESPWWLVRQGRMKEAQHALRQLASADVDVGPSLAVIVETDRLEQLMEAGSTYMDCFRPVNLRRTQIAIGVYCIQVVSGTYLVGYSTYFFELAGLPTQDAFSMGIAFLGVGFIGTVLSWLLLVRYGRREIYLTGLSLLMVLMFVIGILDCVPGYAHHKPVIWAQCSLMLMWNFIYDWSVGPVCFVVLCEVSATKVRSKTIAVATAAQAMLAIGMTFAIPYMINPDQANLRGKIGFFFGGLSALSMIWAWLRIPETKDRTYEELDLMFSRGVKTKDFKHYVVH